MFNKAYGVYVQSPTVFRKWKIMKHSRPIFSKSWIHQIAHIKYWIINDPTNDAIVMLWYKRKFEITVAFRRRRSSTFWKTVEVVRFYTEKTIIDRISNQGHQKYLYQCSFQKFDRKMVNLSQEKRVEWFWVKIMIFDISKINIFEKYFFTGNC